MKVCWKFIFYLTNTKQDHIYHKTANDCSMLCWQLRISWNRNENENFQSPSAENENEKETISSLNKK